MARTLTPSSNTPGSEPIEWTIITPDYQHHTYSAHQIDVTDGGVLLLVDAAGRVRSAIGPAGWARVYRA